MHIVRTIVWVLVLFALLAFSFFNWETVEVQIWDNLVLETKIPALVIVSFLLGLIPMWLVHRGSVWRHRRRISALETAARTSAATTAATTTAATPVEHRTVTEERVVGEPEANEPLSPHEDRPKPKDDILG